jgi:nucleoid DNA-binding protein
MDKIILILADKYKLDPEVIEKIIRSEFNFVKDTMQEGGLESVHLHHFGKFGVKSRYSKIKEDDIKL